MKTFKKPDFLRRLGGWILKLRKTKGIGQDRLTMEAGLAKGTVSKIEGGDVDPKASTLVKLANALDIPPSEMLAIE